jgi:hypothetical protein
MPANVAELIHFFYKGIPGYIKIYPFFNKPRLPALPPSLQRQPKLIDGCVPDLWEMNLRNKTELIIRDKIISSRI